MTLDKAIEIQENSIGFPYSGPWDDKYKATKLGIEALKRVRAGRPAPPSLAYLPLPGETE